MSELTPAGTVRERGFYVDCWYWVKFPAFTYWLTASCKDGRWSCGGYEYYDPDFSVIGPRIPTPDEVAD